MADGAESPFVGRGRELAVLADLLAGAAAGSGGSAVVHGPAGIGKTRLVGAALARSPQLQMVWVSCGELERDVPFAAIADALQVRAASPDPAVATIAELIGGAEHGPARFRVVDALVDHIEHLTLRQPVALVVDDVHRADDGTLLLLRRLVRDAPTQALALICTRRPHPTRVEVDEAFAASLHVGLDALTADEMALLAEASVGIAPDERLTRALVACGGNPLFASELLRALVADERIALGSQSATLIPGEVPATLRLTVLSQLSFLDSAAVEALRVAACFGTSFDMADVALVLGRPTTSVLGVLDPAIRAGVLDSSQVRLAFRHDLVRDAIYDDLPTSAQRGLHADIARTLQDAGRSVSDVAPHLMRSARPGDLDAVRQLHEAAKAAAPLSTVAAAELLEHAIALSPNDDPERPGLMLELAAFHTASGRVAEAEALAKEVLTSGRSGRETAARETLVGALLSRSAAREVVDHVEILEQDETGSTGDRARRLLLAARAWRDIGEHGRAVDAARRAAELADDDDTRCHALWTIALASAAIFDTATTYAVLPEAMELAEHPSISLSTRAEVVATYLFNFGAFDLLRPDARRRAETCLERLESTGHLSLVPDVRAALAWDHVRWGEPEAAVHEAQAAIRAADDLGGTRALTLAHSTLAVGWVYLGDQESGRAALEAAEREGERAGDPDGAMSGLMQARYDVEQASRHSDRALAALWRAFAHHRGGDGSMMQIAPQLVQLIRLLVDGGDNERAREVFDELLDVAGRADGALNQIVGEGTSFMHRLVLQATGLIDSDPEPALAAVDAHRRPPISGVFSLVCALDDAAMVLVRAGRGTEAVPLLEEVRDRWAAVGPSFHVADAEARLRELGVRRGIRGPRRRPSTGWEALTEAELRVAELVAEDLTYREIAERLYVSRRTVESHVTRIFTKLDLSSRRALAREVVARRK